MVHYLEFDERKLNTNFQNVTSHLHTKSHTHGNHLKLAFYVTVHEMVERILFISL